MPVSSVPYHLTYTPDCQGCSSPPLCAVVDDIPLTDKTIISLCTISPAGQGSVVLNGSDCLVWTPLPGASKVVNTCLVACNDGICDTTYIILLPPLPVDTSTGVPCEPGIVYFDRDILPVITANCAYSGCHNAKDRKDGVILDSYDNIVKTGRVVGFNLSKSKLYETITETDKDDIMPPSPSLPLTSAQINLVAKWIEQGAKNLSCSDSSSPCNTDNVSFTSFVKPALAACTNCHRAGNSSGGINLETHSGVSSVGVNGRLVASITWAAGTKAMPPGGTKLPDCTISKIKSWVNAGAPNN